VELNVGVTREVSADQINAAYQAAADGSLQGVLEYSTYPLVSSDIVRNPASSIFDSLLTQSGGRFVKVSAWYDNEWGFSNRVVDSLELLGH
jgi:glyceraldehyde 3-phosphate dehydrogenase